MPYVYLLYQLGRALTAIPPQQNGRRVADALGDAWYRLAPTQRRAIQANLSMVTGETHGQESPLVREVFRNFARYLFEFFHAHRHDHKHVMIEGESSLQRAWEQGRGVIVFTAHLGNWELGAMTLHRLGYPTTAVALPHIDPRANTLFDRQRRRCGVDVIAVGPHATKQALEVLRNGGVLGIAGDREFGTNGIAIHAWGQSVIMPKGPALLSLRTGAPVVPAFLLREASGQLRLHIEPAIWPQDVRMAGQAVRTLTQRYSDVLSRYIRRYPAQWLLFDPIVQARDVHDHKREKPDRARLCRDSSV